MSDNSGKRRLFSIKSITPTGTGCDVPCDATLRSHFVNNSGEEEEMLWLCANDPAAYELECVDTQDGTRQTFFLCAQHVRWIQKNGKIFLSYDDGVALLIPSDSMVAEL